MYVFLATEFSWSRIELIVDDTNTSNEDEMSSWIVVEEENRNHLQFPEDDSILSIDESSGEISCHFDIAMASTRNFPWCVWNMDDGTKTPTTTNKEVTKIRRSIRKSIDDAFTTPVRAAKAKLQESNSVSSPMVLVENFKRSITKKQIANKKSDSSKWWEELDLPKNTTKEQALAVLLCRELEAIDI